LFPPKPEVGSAVVEVVLVIPVVMLVVAIAIQMAIWSDAAQTVQVAAALGDQTAAGYGSSVVSGKSTTESYLSEHGELLQKGTSVVAKSLPQGFVWVRVDASAVSIIPFLHLGVSAVRVAPVQEFRESG
jgi:hypothetical protein